MVERNIFAGFGGQGVLLMGQLLAAAGMKEGKNTSWIPSYGPEMRGGTANCSVMLSEQEIDSPLVTRPTSLIVMNRPSLEKFEDSVVPGGSIFVNSSMIDIKVKRTDVNAYYVPCTEIATELGNPKVSNMIMLGAYLGKLTRGKAIDRWRSLRREKRGGGSAVTLALEEIAEVIPAKDEPEQALLHKELRRAIHRFLDSLGETERNVFLCRYWYFEDIDGICARFEFSRSKVESMLHRSREKLKRFLQKEELI